MKNCSDYYRGSIQNWKYSVRPLQNTARFILRWPSFKNDLIGNTANKKTHHITQYSQKCRIEFNVSKCVTLLFQRMRSLETNICNVKLNGKSKRRKGLLSYPCSTLVVEQVAPNLPEQVNCTFFV